MQNSAQAPSPIHSCGDARRGLPGCYNSIGSGGFATRVGAPKPPTTDTSRAEPKVFIDQGF